MEVGLLNNGNRIVVKTANGKEIDVLKKEKKSKQVLLAQWDDKYVLYEVDGQGKACNLNLHSNQTKAKEVFNAQAKEKIQVNIREVFDDINREYKETSRRGGRRGATRKTNDSNTRRTQGSVASAKGPRNTTSQSPYNFIPLSEIIARSENNFSHDSFHKGSLSGFIDYTIVTKSPLYIRGTALDTDKTNPEPSYFFGVSSEGGELKIPGSSIRGMLRNIIEIVSYSRMEIIDSDKFLFYRDVGGTGDYRNRVSGQPSYNNLRGGWIKKDIGGVRFSEAKPIYGQYKLLAVEGRYRNDQFTPNGSRTNLEIGAFAKVKFDGNEIRPADRSAISRVLRLNDQGSISATLVVSGDIYRKKRNVAIGDRKDNGRDIRESWEIYCQDKQREFGGKKGKNDLEVKIEKARGGWVPCFYIEEGGQIILGDTPMLRLPFRNKISSFLPDDHNDNVVDMANSIFGNMDMSSKLSVDDVYPIDTTLTDTNRNTQRQSIKALSSPKPTSYQLYLEPTEHGQLTTYNDEGRIRGHKLYWHRMGENWILDRDRKKFDAKPIRPIPANSIFNGKLRFDNLTPYELGALLIALDLPEECGHKLGMGKPYGLGSIRIDDIKLNIIDRVDRYQSVFSDGQWKESCNESMDIKSYKMEFIKFLGTKDIKFTSVDEFWNDTKRIGHLKSILTIVKGEEDWLDRTRYMEIERPIYDESGQPEMNDRGRPKKINEYKDRKILDSPTNIYSR